MKKKYFLRGVGLGILITTMVFILVGKQEFSDEEVLKRAKELGYVKAEENPTPTIDINSLLEKELTPIPTITVAETVTPQPTMELEITDRPEPSDAPETIPDSSGPLDSTPSPELTEIPDVTIVPDSSADSENTPDTGLSPTPSVIPQDSEEENKAEDESEVVQTSFRVKYGTDVSDICKQLEEAGIIKSASEFKRYLVDHKIDNTIRAGLYKISSDMTYEELANVLRRQNNN